ncbi:PP2C family protein-serine/threonine phosphatase [Micromonospora sediminicola]|nr:PP2C family protein-serine/threonine phosphatase [Micromonospora sediminicola]
MVRRAVRELGASDAVMFLVDHHQRVLAPLSDERSPRRELIAVDGTLPGRAYSTMRAVAAVGGDASAWFPLVDGLERLGVVEIIGPGELLNTRQAELADVAALLAELVITRGMYSDTVERIRRREPMNLAAEMLRAQLPPLTFATSNMVISGILEPAYDVGGDAFDFAVNGDVAHLALFDAVGHGSQSDLRAVMLASIALAAYRNARRAGYDLVATYHHIDAAARGFDRSGLITGVFGELDQRTGQLRVISAGHPSGIVLRQGKIAAVLPTPTALPVTLGEYRQPVVTRYSLEPGDDVLLYTDGITEARSADGELFGLERLSDLAVRALADDLPLPEIARRLVHAVIAHQDNRLQDDATVLFVRWTGAPDGGEDGRNEAPRNTGVEDDTGHLRR